jgi:signal transduction histidine kinase
VTILIADDNELNLKLLRAVLEAEGHVVHSANDGIEALDVLKEKPVDAIISDILMPRMDGYRLCQEVRQAPQWQRLPFIFYTATYTSPTDEGLALKVGADRYLRKPAPAQALISALEEASQESRVSRGVAPSHPSTSAVMKEYNEALVRKLEEKNSELQSAQAEILKANEELEERVRARTAELEAANHELEAFSHSAAHDLRAPLRAVSGYSQLVIEDAGDQLGPEGIEYLNRIKDSARRMNDLIEELLKLSLVGRCAITKQSIDLSALAHEVAAELQRREPERRVEFVIEPGLVVEGDGPLLRIALENLISNASKFSSKQEHSRIELGRRPSADRGIYFVRDNGVGFDMDYVDKLFKPFERMHLQTDFPGTGLGLTIVQRIIARHGSDIWVESAPGEGATFFFNL